MPANSRWDLIQRLKCNLAHHTDNWRALGKVVVIYGLHKMRGVSSRDEEVLCPQEGVCSMELDEFILQYTASHLTAAKPQTSHGRQTV